MVCLLLGLQRGKYRKLLGYPLRSPLGIHQKGHSQYVRLRIWISVSPQSALIGTHTDETVEVKR